MERQSLAESEHPTPSNTLSTGMMEKIRQQFDAAPYPNIPLDKTPASNPDFLFIHSLVTAYYLRYQQVIDPCDRVILDAGCGTGYLTLALAMANPGAKIVGIDLSAKSIELAAGRLRYHGFDNSEFHQMTLEELPSLGLEFDYINCDEVLTLLPNLAEGLTILGNVLKPHGIIRGNVHSRRQRDKYFTAQELFTMMGLMEGNPEALELSVVRDTMRALKDPVALKAATWNEERSENDHFILMNYLYQGDRGYSIPELFAALQTADLDFISMVKWRLWELLDLFKTPNDLPPFWAMSLPDLSLEERLTLYELINPVNRLLDFWCGHPQAEPIPSPVLGWDLADWQSTTIHLHPQLRTDAVRQALTGCVTNRVSFCISKHLPHPATTDIVLESTMAAMLLPLLSGPLAFPDLVTYWQRIKPVNPVTLELISTDMAAQQIAQFLAYLESYLYILVDSKGSNAIF